MSDNVKERQSRRDQGPQRLVHDRRRLHQGHRQGELRPFPRKTVVGVVGESGSGKSVTARSIIKLLPETATTSGAVYLSNRAGSEALDVLSPVRRTAARNARLRSGHGVPGAQFGAQPGVHHRLADRGGPARPRHEGQEGTAVPRPSTSSRRSASRTPKPASTTTHTSSPAARSSASSSPWRWCSTPA